MVQTPPPPWNFQSCLLKMLLLGPPSPSEFPVTILVVGMDLQRQAARPLDAVHGLPPLAPQYDLCGVNNGFLILLWRCWGWSQPLSETMILRERHESITRLAGWRRRIDPTKKTGMREEPSGLHAPSLLSGMEA